MIKIERTSVMNFENAIRGARNPLNSWDKSDSFFDENGNYVLGPNDLSLASRLCRAGSDHRKFVRQIFVSADITAPLYWWKEFDTYKIGTVANSCSTMHKIHSRDLTLNDFSTEHLSKTNLIVVDMVIDAINNARQDFLQNHEKIDWWQMIQLLPSSYNQKRTVMMNYEVIARIIEQRSHHKLDEWHQLIDVLGGLPYMQELMK